MNKQKLQAFAKRLNTIDDELEELRQNRREFLAEVTEAGFRAKALQRAVKYQRRDTEGRATADDLEALTEQYKAALGLTPIETLIADSGVEAVIVESDKSNGKDKPAEASAPPA